MIGAADEPVLAGLFYLVHLRIPFSHFAVLDTFLPSNLAQFSQMQAEGVAQPSWHAWLKLTMSQVGKMTKPKFTCLVGLCYLYAIETVLRLSDGA